MKDRDEETGLILRSDGDQDGTLMTRLLLNPGKKTMMN